MLLPYVRCSIVLVPLAALACGGSTEDSGGTESLGTGGGGPGSADAGTGGSGEAGGGLGGSGWVGGSTGGSGQAGSAMGGMGQAGAGTGGTSVGGSAGAKVCCLAEATCGPGETQVAGPDACPPGGDCYSSSICCSTVWCLREQAICDAYPTCSLGDTEVAVCPAGGSCYERTLCGSTILCAASVDGGAGCNPATEYNRDYVGTPETCPVIDFTCAAPTMHFQNACGCGCEQDPSCPEWVDCMPPTDDPRCAPDGLSMCPFTQIAF